MSKNDLESFIKLLSVFCPHISEELWSKLGNKDLVSLASWPVEDNSKIDSKFEQAEEAMDKSVGDIVNVLRIVKEKQGKDADGVYIYVLPNELSHYSSEELTSRVGKPVKVFAVNDKNKHDPEGKASKAKPGKPGIYVE